MVSLLLNFSIIYIIIELHFQEDNVNVEHNICISLIELIQKTNCDIATCGMVFKNESNINNPNMVKIVGELETIKQF